MGAVIVFALVCGSAPTVLEAIAGTARSSARIPGREATLTTAVRLGSEPDEIARASIILAARMGPTVVVGNRHRPLLDELGPVGVQVYVAATTELALREAAGAIDTAAVIVVSASAFPTPEARRAAGVLDEGIGWATGRVASPNDDRFAPREREAVAQRLRSNARSAGATLWETDATVVRTDLVVAHLIDGTRPWGHWLRELEGLGVRGVEVTERIALRAAPTDAPVFWPSQMIRTRAAAADLAGAVTRGPVRARLLATAALARELYAWPLALWAAVPLLIGWSGSSPLSCAPIVFVAVAGAAAVGRWSASRLRYGVGLHPVRDARAAAYDAPGSFLALPSAVFGRIRPRRIGIPAQPLLWFAVAFTFATSVVLLERAATSDAGANVAAGAAVMNLVMSWTFAIRAIGKRAWDRVVYRLEVDLPALVDGRAARVVEASANGCAVVGALDGVDVGASVAIVVELPEHPALCLRGRVTNRRAGFGQVVLGVSLDLDPRARIDWIAGFFDPARAASVPRSRSLEGRVGSRARGRPAALRTLWFRFEMVLVVAVSLFAAGILTMVLLGFRPLVISSGSMRPRLQVGDVVVTTWVRARDVRVGEIVSFDERVGSGRLVTHRVRGITAVGADLRFETRGDANTTSEIWEVPRATLLRRMVWDVPSIGAGASALGSSGTRGILVSGGAALAATVTGLALRKQRRAAEPLSTQAIRP